MTATKLVTVSGRIVGDAEFPNHRGCNFLRGCKPISHGMQSIPAGYVAVLDYLASRGKAKLDSLSGYPVNRG